MLGCLYVISMVSACSKFQWFEDKLKNHFSPIQLGEDSQRLKSSSSCWHHFSLWFILKGFEYNEENLLWDFSSVLGHIWLSVGMNGVMGKITCKILQSLLSNAYWDTLNTESLPCTNPDKFAGQYLLSVQERARQFSEFSSKTGQWSTLFRVKIGANMGWLSGCHQNVL